MRLLVTGAAGFIGFHLVKKISEQYPDYHIVGLDSINNYYDINLKISRLKNIGIDIDEALDGREIKSKVLPNFYFYKGHLENRELLLRIFEKEKFTHVCNLAAQAGVRYSLINPQAYIDSNIIGFANIIEFSRQFNIEHFVYASSSSVYGLNEEMPFSVHHNVDHPISLYAASKKSNELIAHSYSYLFNLPTTGLRFFTVYGPWGRPDMAMFLFTKAIIEGKPIKVFNNGNMKRDFTYIDDIVEGVMRVIHKTASSNPEWTGLNPDSSSSKAAYKIYNIGNNHPVSISKFIDVLEKELDMPATRELMPLQPGDVPETFADIDNLIEDIGYKPNVSLETGIKNFVNWYKEYYL
jgi:UDP-glucuronate 4-epimerase